ncbi:MAG: alpha/beta hydrolase [Rhodospirillaceae bacterium]|jgi:pimeloyl-ACP methyl ester carboxylesterase
MSGQGDIQSEEHWANKDGLKLYMYRKYTGERPGQARPKPVFFLVHGSSFCGRTGFDLTVPGKDDYSFMDAFARRGFDVWTMDHDGYGRSDHSGGNSDIATAVGDLSAGCDVVQRETGQNSYAFYGSSSGALRASIFAEHHPDKVERLIVDAHVYTGKGSPTLAKRREGLDGFRANNMRAVDKAFFLSIFTRDKPGTSEDGVGEALAAEELALCNQVPTGTYLDMCANLPVNDPTKITCPVQIIRGEFDGIATEEDLIDFYLKLPNKDKQFVIIPGQAHVAPLGLNRHRFWHVVESFLTMPARRDQ